MQNAFADSSFEPLQSLQFVVVFVRAENYLCWIAQVLFLFYFKSDSVAESEEELAFAQYVGLTPSTNEIGRELHLLSLTRDGDDEIEHSINFNSCRSGTIKSGEW